MPRPSVAFFGPSLVSSHRADAVYFRGIIRALHGRGWSVTVYQPDAYDRQPQADVEALDWVKVMVYDPSNVQAVLDLVATAARQSDIVVKASAVGVHDELLETSLPHLCPEGRLCVYWDADAAATIERMQQTEFDPLRVSLPRYDVVLTCGGGAPVVAAYHALGARHCVPVDYALDPTTHFPVAAEGRFSADLAFLDDRVAAREARVDELFLRAAVALPGRRFLLGGHGWHDRDLPLNVHCIGHVPIRDHNALNCSVTAVLTINGGGLASFGHWPSPRVFEGAGAGACVITEAFEGLEQLLEPDREVLVVGSADDVAARLDALTPEHAAAIGRAARARMLAAHTYEHRAGLVEDTLTGGVPKLQAC